MLLAVILVLAIVAMTLIAALQYFSQIERKRWKVKTEILPVSGFFERYSYVQGEDLRLFYHSDSPATLLIHRLGARREEPAVTRSLSPRHQDRGRYDLWKGCEWPEAEEIGSEALQPGLHVAEIRQTSGNHLFRIPLIISPPETVDIAIICSTNTWDAYNAYGGLSNYVDTATPAPLRLFKGVLMLLRVVVGVPDRFFPHVPLARKRPNIRVDEDLRDLPADPLDNHGSHLTRADWHLIAFLEREGISYGVYDESDWAFGHRPHQAKLAVFQTHAEYWSEEALFRFLEFRRRGGDIALLSGNNRRCIVRPYEEGIAVVSQWCPQAENAQLFGSAFDKRGAYTYAGYEVVAPQHWLFEGTGLKPGSTFGEISANCDRPDTPARQPGASGHEIDKLHPAGTAFDLVALGRNAGGGAAMMCRDDGDGGFVFNASSLTFTGSLGLDGAVDRIVLNLIRRSCDRRRSDQ